VTTSVVVATLGRSAIFERCLSAIASGAYGATEVVVVDQSSEGIGGAAASALAASATRARHVRTAPAGVSAARNLGAREATGDLLAFTDDDCVPERDWIRNILVAFDTHPDIAVVGGRVDLADAADLPVSIRTHAEVESIGDLQQMMNWMSGCNMAFRREVFERVGLFDPAFGKGRPIGSGEDIDLLYRAWKAGLRLLYQPDVRIRHAHGRATAEARESVNRDYVKGRGAFYCKFISDAQVARLAYWEIAKTLRLAMRSPRELATLRDLADGAARQVLSGVLGLLAQRRHLLEEHV